MEIFCIGDAGHSLVYLPSNGTSLELHHVSRESASLVGKYVTNHPEFLIEITRSGHCRCITVRVIHLNVHVYECCLNKPHNLESHLQRNRDEVVE